MAQILLLAALLAGWEYLTSKAALSAFLFGSPSAIWGFLVTMWQDGSLFRDTYVTGMETLAGFVIGNVVGTVIGLRSGTRASSRGSSSLSSWRWARSRSSRSPRS